MNKYVIGMVACLALGACESRDHGKEGHGDAYEILKEYAKFEVGDIVRSNTSDFPVNYIVIDPWHSCNHLFSCTQMLEYNENRHNVEVLYINGPNNKKTKLIFLQNELEKTE